METIFRSSTCHLVKVFHRQQELDELIAQHKPCWLLGGGRDGRATVFRKSAASEVLGKEGCMPASQKRDRVEEEYLLSPVILVSLGQCVCACV